MRYSRSQGSFGASVVVVVPLVVGTGRGVCMWGVVVRGLWVVTGAVILPTTWAWVVFGPDVICPPGFLQSGARRRTKRATQMMQRTATKNSKAAVDLRTNTCPIFSRGERVFLIFSSH